MAKKIKEHISKDITARLYQKTLNWYDEAYSYEKRLEKGFGWPEEKIDKEDRELIKKKDIKKNSCLEIGFGDGRNLNYLMKNFKKVIGLDISINAKNKALKRFKDIKKPVLLVENLLNFNTKNRFDFIFEYSVMNHTPRKLLNQYSQKISSLLKSKGSYLIVVFSDKDSDCPKKGYKIYKGQYFNFFSKSDINKLFPNFMIKDKKTSILKLKRESVVFKNKKEYIMNHYLLQKK